MPDNNPPTRHSITDIVNVTSSRRYEYGTSTIIAPGVSITRKKRRIVYTRTYEIHLRGNTADLDPEPIMSIPDFLCEEAVEDQTLCEPLKVIHRETWTKRGKWEYYEEN